MIGQIESNIPIPPVMRAYDRAERLGIPWGKLDVGDSVLVAGRFDWIKPPRKKRDTRKFTQRVTPEGVRIWRIA